MNYLSTFKISYIIYSVVILNKSDWYIIDKLPLIELDKKGFSYNIMY